MPCMKRLELHRWRCVRVGQRPDARVADEWSSDGWIRSRVRRWILKATTMVEVGWRELVSRTVPEE